MHVTTQVAIIFYNKLKIPNSTKQIKKQAPHGSSACYQRQNMERKGDGPSN